MTTTNAPRAVLYLRQSLDRTGEALAVDRQRRDCRKLAKARGYKVVQEYVDNDVSASSKRPRPEYQQMLADAEAGHFEVVIAWHLDRLTRTMRDLESLIELSERTGAKVATVSGDVDLTTDAGRLVGRILASVARGEVERKSARQVAAARQKADRGLPHGRAFGYSSDGLTVVEAEADVVRAAAARLLAGDTLVGIARWLEETGAPSPRGKGWNRITLRHLLMRPRYAGIATYKGVEVGPGQAPAILDEATLRACQAILSDPKRKLNKVGNRRAHLLSGLAVCATCGAKVRTTGPTQTYRYLCAGHMVRTGGRIDEYVQAVIAERLRRPDVAALLARDEADRAEPLRAKAATLRLRLEQLADDYAAGLLDGAQTHRASERIRTDLAEVEDELGRIGRANGLGPVLAAPDPGAAFLEAPLGVRRAVVQALATVTLVRVSPGMGRLGLDPDTVVIEWKAGQ